jgi:FMN phosphatase YigB (HAD superfamily)
MGLSVPRIERVVFDIGGVLCTFTPDRRLEALSRLTGLEPTRVHDAIWGSGLDASADRGDFNLDENFEAVLGALSNRLDEAQLLETWALAFSPDPIVAGIADRLEVPCSAFSNNGPLLKACISRGLISLPAACQPVIYSWQLGAAKPEQLAFQRAAMLLDTEPEHLLLVDDSAANVGGALDSGWQALLFPGPTELHRLLDRLGVAYTG